MFRFIKKRIYILIKTEIEKEKEVLIRKIKEDCERECQKKIDEYEKKLREVSLTSAINIVWDIMKEETKHLIELEKNDAYDKAEKEAIAIYENKLNEIINKNISSINLPLLIKSRDYAKSQYLSAQKVGEPNKTNYFKGQLDLIAEIYNEKI